MTLSCSIEVHDRCSSTMDLAKIWVQKNGETGQPHFIQSYTQDAGRGKRERVWVSERGNFFGTFVLPFPFGMEKRGDISFLTAVAIGDVLKTIHPSLNFQFKWPNDILISKKKVGGVLLEYLEGENDRSFLSIGIGLNFISHPDHIPSTCLMDYMDTVPSLEYFRNLLIEKMFHYYESWVTHGFLAIRTLWLKRAIDLNEFIQFSIGNETIRGIFKTINDNGGLILVCQDGIEKTFYTGEVFFDS
ncbi:MAG TPA: biotin--[acetyl-CoA-carboxylase] ligase [Holosporales bacterium]|nr:biotin--[acetyl-CoA-carboxylase] ligase [Holosporales bacterium]